MVPFRPIFRNPHLLTIAGNFWPRKSPAPCLPLESKLYQTDRDTQVLVHTQRPVTAPGAGEIVLVHGLEGSGDAGYMRSMAHAGLEAGYVVHRFHMRTCGGTGHLCRTLYHAGLTSDLLAVLRDLQKQKRAPVHLVGYSLGGNVVLKLAGELGEQGPALIASVSALSTPIDLAACARRIGRLDNRLYERRFLKKMRQRIGATGQFSKKELQLATSIFEFDDRFTGPSFGFRDAEEYYATQSAQNFLDKIRVPALLIQARDDTFIPFAVFDHPAFQRNPCLHLLATKHGGHLGFISRTAPRFWSDVVVLEWIAKHSVAVATASAADLA